MWSLQSEPQGESEPQTKSTRPHEDDGTRWGNPPPLPLQDIKVMHAWLKSSNDQPSLITETGPGAEATDETDLTFMWMVFKKVQAGEERPYKEEERWCTYGTYDQSVFLQKTLNHVLFARPDTNKRLWVEIGFFEREEDGYFLRFEGGFGTKTHPKT